MTLNEVVVVALKGVVVVVDNVVVEKVVVEIAEHFQTGQ